MAPLLRPPARAIVAFGCRAVRGAAAQRQGLVKDSIELAATTRLMGSASHGQVMAGEGLDALS
jgi:hypothetical protein